MINALPRITAAIALPPDDSARGFDNIAGSLTISPTLLEAYMTAATRISSMAVGYWKTPTESAYIAPGDTSQNEHIEGLPFGTRGGMLVRHSFPADGDYKFSIQNFVLDKYVPGEQLELLIDGERVHLFPYVGIGLSQGMGETDGSLEVTVPVKAGTHMVGATFLATNYRPSLDLIRHYERTSLENNSIPQLQYYPAIGFSGFKAPSIPPVRKTRAPSPSCWAAISPAAASPNPALTEGGMDRRTTATNRTTWPTTPR
jgi:Protein of unknown function (DUF1587)